MRMNESHKQKCPVCSWRGNYKSLCPNCGDILSLADGNENTGAPGMISTITSLRTKYAKRRTAAGQLRHAPGGEDVLRLCNICDRMEAIIRYAQAQLPTDQQNEIEKRLWTVTYD